MGKIDFSSWLGKIVWLAGLILVILGRDYVENHILWQLRLENKELFLQAILLFLLPFLTGLYLSLLFYWSGFKAVDVSLLAVIAIPALVLSLLPVVAQQLPLVLPEEVQWLVTTLNTGDLLALVAGLTLIPALQFKQKRRYR